MIIQYKEILKELNDFIDKSQFFLDSLLEELQVLEAEEKQTGVINTNYTHELLRGLSVESDLIKEREFKLGFTITEINFRARMIDGRREYENYIKTKRVEKEPVNKLEKMIQGLSKEDIQQLLKNL